MKEEKKILLKKLSEFLGQKEFGEFRKLLQKENSSKKQKVFSSTLSEEKQLSVEFSSPLDFYSNIDLLITFVSDKLTYKNLTKLLLFIGEDLTAVPWILHKKYSFIFCIYHRINRAITR